MLTSCHSSGQGSLNMFTGCIMRNQIFHLICCTFCLILPSSYSYGEDVTSELFTDINFMRDIPLYKDNKIIAIVESSAGSRDIWKVDVKKGGIYWHKDKDLPERLDFTLGYPANLAFFPRTKSFPPHGNGKEPLRTFIIGGQLRTGSIVFVKPIAALLLNENNIKSTILISIQSEEINQLMMQDYRDEISVISYWLKSYKDGVSVESQIVNNINILRDIIDVSKYNYK